MIGSKWARNTGIKEAVAEVTEWKCEAEFNNGKYKADLSIRIPSNITTILEFRMQLQNDPRIGQEKYYMKGCIWSSELILENTVQ